MEKRNFWRSLAYANRCHICTFMQLCAISKQNSMYTITTVREGASRITDEETKLIVKELIQEYKSRETKQLLNAKLALYGIILCLVLCLGIFLFANFLTESRASKIAAINVQQIEALLTANISSIDSLERTEKRIDMELSYLTKNEYVAEDTTPMYMDSTMTTPTTVTDSSTVFKAPIDPVTKRKQDSLIHIQDSISQIQIALSRRIQDSLNKNDTI